MNPKVLFNLSFLFILILIRNAFFFCDAEIEGKAELKIKRVDFRSLTPDQLKEFERETREFNTEYKASQRK